MNEKVHLLRNYQKEIVARVLQEWKQVRSVMVQMPTGTGKTHVLASIMERFSGKTLVVAHRAELEKEIRQEQETNEENKKQKIQEDYHRAVPYQSGMKWGLKVGERITVPPIYRHIQKPVGKYCAVEKNYSQWGIISIDGTILVEPRYPEVSIESNGTALLTQVTGKKTTIHLK